MKNAGKACNNRLYRHIRTFEKIVKNYFVIYIKKLRKSKKYLLKSVHEGVILADTFIFRMKQCKPDFVPASGDKVRLFLRC